MTIETLFLIALLLSLFALIGIKRPVLAFCLVVAIAPWQSLMVDIGLRVTLHILSMAGLISAMLVTPWEKWRNTFTNKIWWPLYVVLLWVLTTNLFQLPNSTEVQIIGGIMRSPIYRSWVQFGSLLLTLLPVFVAPLIVTSRKDLFLVVKFFICSIFILAILGWLQLLSNSLFNYYPIPIGFVNNLLNGMQVKGSSGIPVDLIDGHMLIYRMVSLGGEPRYLSQSIATALLIVQIFWMQNILKFERISISFFIFLLLSLLATYSSSGMLLWIICVFIINLYYYKNNFYLYKSKRNWAIICASITALAFLLLAIRKIVTNLDLEYFYIFKRIMSRGIIADFDTVVINFLVANFRYVWFGVGLGNIHLYATPYLSPYFKDFASNAAFVADSGWLRLISEVGLIGMSLFLWWCWKIWTNLVKLKATLEWDKAITVLKPMFLVAVIGYLARGTTFAPIAFIIFAITIVPIILYQKTPLFLNNDY